mmetsp:Transcript_20625/g.49094  ORF Transcript_20625/g.49094 Transcript_20625/m.49094 type:complete len:397 (+) Transcript_20625:541-1731(+)
MAAVARHILDRRFGDVFAEREQERAAPRQRRGGGRRAAVAVAPHGGLGRCRARRVPSGAEAPAQHGDLRPRRHVLLPGPPRHRVRAAAHPRRGVVPRGARQADEDAPLRLHEADARAGQGHSLAALPAAANARPGAARVPPRLRGPPQRRNGALRPPRGAAGAAAAPAAALLCDRLGDHVVLPRGGGAAGRLPPVRPLPLGASPHAHLRRGGVPWPRPGGHPGLRRVRLPRAPRGAQGPRRRRGAVAGRGRPRRAAALREAPAVRRAEGGARAGSRAPQRCLGLGARRRPSDRPRGLDRRSDALTRRLARRHWRSPQIRGPAEAPLHRRGCLRPRVHRAVALHRLHRPPALTVAQKDPFRLPSASVPSLSPEPLVPYAGHRPRCLVSHAGGASLGC